MNTIEQQLMPTYRLSLEEKKKEEEEEERYTCLVN